MSDPTNPPPTQPGSPSASAEPAVPPTSSQASPPAKPAGPAALPAPTPSVEDYLERIADLIAAKGYARAVDIAENLGIQQPSVTKMLQRLHEQGYIVYEKYRGLVLTDRGAKLAESVKFRHDVLMRLLNLLGLSGAQTLADVEGIEHHVSGETIGRVAEFVRYLEENPAFVRGFLDRVPPTAPAAPVAAAAEPSAGPSDTSK